jgi:hypothetical protein
MTQTIGRPQGNTCSQLQKLVSLIKSLRPHAYRSGAITAMLTNPIWVVKTRVFATPRNDPSAYRGLWGESCLCSFTLQRLTPDLPDGLRTIYRHEGMRGLYKGSLLALVGVSNGSIQFAAYEEIKRRRTDIKRKLIEREGRAWHVADEKLVSSSPRFSSSLLIAVQYRVYLGFGKQ